MSMRCGNAGNPYLSKYWTNMPHALKTKRVRKKGSVPWINKDIKAKLFERDFLKRKAIKTSGESDWNNYKSSRNACNIALRHAKREYYATKFLNTKTIQNMPGKQLMIS